MQRKQVTEVVKRYMLEVVDELDPAQLNLSISMKDMGVNSLDIVEIVSCSMRELRVKVPRVELQNLETVDQFVDLLHGIVQENRG